MQELAEGLVKRGFCVCVATTYPAYNLAEKSDNDYPEVSLENGINVIRIKTLPHHKVNFIVRGLSQVTMPYLFLKKIKQYCDKVDSVLVYSPPLPLSIVGEKVKKLFGAKYVLNVQDIFPQNAIDLGVLRNRLLISYFKRLEERAYREADIVTVHSEGNYNFLMERYPHLGNKLKVLHNWMDTQEFEGIQVNGAFRKKYSLENKFIVLFAGVMGPSQGLTFLLQVAEKVKEFSEIVFLLVGDGMEKEELVRKAELKGLQNVIFAPFVPKKEYPSLVKECNVGLVSLTNQNKTPVVPGKLLGYMAAGIPVLAFLNKESDGHAIVHKAQCGYSSIWGDTETAISNLLKLYKDKSNTLGQNGFRYVKSHFSREEILEQILQYIQS